MNCELSEPKLQNVVVMFTVKCLQDKSKLVFSHKKRGLEGKRNFYIIKPPSLKPSYTVFPNSGNVIATGIRSMDGVQPALETFAALEGLGVANWPSRVVNSTYAGVIKSYITSAHPCQVMNRFQLDQEASKGVSIIRDQA